MQDIIAWLILPESWESQLHHGVSHFLRRKFCEKWKFAVYNELLNFWSILTVRGCDVGRWNDDGTTSYFNIRVRELIVLTTKIVGTQHMILNCVKIAQSCSFFPPATQLYLLCRELVKKTRCISAKHCNAYPIVGYQSEMGSFSISWNFAGYLKHFTVGGKGNGDIFDSVVTSYWKTFCFIRS